MVAWSEPGLSPVSDHVGNRSRSSSPAVDQANLTMEPNGDSGEPLHRAPSQSAQQRVSPLSSTTPRPGSFWVRSAHTQLSRLHEAF